MTLTGVDDADVDGTQEYRVTLTVNTGSTADAGYDAVGPVTVTAVNQDNEYGLDVSAVTGQPRKGAARPPSRWRCRRTHGRRNGGRGEPGSERRRGRAGAVDIHAHADDLEHGPAGNGDGAGRRRGRRDPPYAVRLTPSSSDPNYNALMPEDVTVTTTDDETRPTVTPGGVKYGHHGGRGRDHGDGHAVGQIKPSGDAHGDGGGGGGLGRGGGGTSRRAGRC